MGILNFSLRTPPPPAPSDRRKELIARRKAIQSKQNDVNAKIAARAAKLPREDEAVRAVAEAERLYAAGRVAEELGEPTSAPLDVLKRQLAEARQRMQDAALEAADHRAIIAQYHEESQKLRDMQSEIRRELHDLVMPIIDERLASNLKKRTAAVEAALAVLREEHVLCLAFDTFAMSQARGEFRGSAQYPTFRFPTPQHPAYLKEYSDAFVRGRALAQEHADYHEAQKAIEQEAQHLISDLMNGDI